MGGSVLVLGAGGLVGSALVRTGRVYGLDRAALDITDPEAVASALDTLAPSAVINAAAQARVDEAEREPARAWRVNAQAPAALASACAERGIRLVHLSTDYVLDSEAPGRLDERTPPRPRSVYAASKRAGEEEALQHGAVVVRIQWVYAPGHAGFFTRSLRALADGAPLKLVVDQVGSPTPAELLAPALLRAAEPGPTGLYHLATTGEATPWTWIAAAAALLGLPFAAEPLTRATLGGAHRPARSLLDSARFNTTFGVGLPDWEEGLRQVLGAAPRPPLSPRAPPARG